MRGLDLGAMRVESVVEMESGLPMGMVLPGVTAQDLARLKGWYWDDTLSLVPAEAQFRLSIHSWVLRIAGKTILIDACNGNHKHRSVPFAHQLDTPWLERLTALGLQPEDIDLVMCTHLHADHVGWNTRLVDGRWVPTFPNARYVLGRRDLAHFSHQDHEAFHREAYADSVLPVVEAGQAQVVDEDAVVLGRVGEGVWLQPAIGHSPGSCLVHACHGGPGAVFSGDALHHPVQLIRPDLAFFADWDAALAVQVRHALLQALAGTDTMLFPAHFVGPGAGWVERDGDAYRLRYAKN